MKLNNYPKSSQLMARSSILRQAILCIAACFFSCSAWATNCSDITGGSIGSSQTICTGGDPAIFTNVTSATTGQGTGVKYIWLRYVGASAPTDVSLATVISGATSATYNPPAGSVTAKTWFRRCSAPNSASCTVYNGETSWVSVSVSAPTALTCQASVNGTWSTLSSCAVSACTGNSLWLSVNPNVSTVTWTGPNGFTASGNDALVSNSVTTANAGTYTAALTQNGCTSTTTIQVTITSCGVNCSDITAGSIGSSQTICTGGDPAIFTNVTSATTGQGTGVKYIWLRYVGASAPASSTITGVATVISGATSATYNPPAGSVTAKTWFRRCSAPNSASCTVYNGETSWVSVDVTSCTNCTGNLLLNPGFESGLTSWVNWGSATAGTMPYSGTKNATVCTSTYGGFGQDVSATAGTTYTLTAYAKVSGSPNWAGIGFDYYDANWTQIGSSASTTVSATNYTLYTATGIAPVGTAYVTAWGWKDANGCLYVDDFCLTSSGGGTVNCNDITAGSIGSNQSICTSGDPAIINSLTAATTGQGTGVKYIWLRFVGASAPASSTTTGVTTISGATGATYDPPAGSVTAKTWFRRCSAPNSASCTVYNGETSWVSVDVTSCTSSCNTTPINPCASTVSNAYNIIDPGVFCPGVTNWVQDQHVFSLNNTSASGPYLIKPGTTPYLVRNSDGTVRLLLEVVKSTGAAVPNVGYDNTRGFIVEVVGSNLTQNTPSGSYTPATENCAGTNTTNWSFYNTFTLNACGTGNNSSINFQVVNPNQAYNHPFQLGNGASTWNNSFSGGVWFNNGSISGDLQFRLSNYVNSTSANIAGTTSICSGGSTTLTASGGGTYLWNTGATTAAINVNPTANTTYTVTVTNGGCTATATKAVTVGAVSANIAGTTSICSGGSTTLTASGGGTYLWNTGATTAAINVNPTANTTYTVTVTNGGCTATATKAVTVGAASANIAGTTSICSGGSTTLTASGGGTYLWNTGATTAAITVNPTANTTYTVTVTNGGCTATATKAVTVGAVSANIAGTTAICSGGSTTLTASGGGTYVWSTGSTTAAITVNPTANTTYTVTVTNGGCTATATRAVTVGAASASIAGTTAICSGGSTTLTASGGGTYVWSTGSTTAAITVNPTANTTYTVTVTNGGCTATATRAVTITGPITSGITSPSTTCALENVLVQAQNVDATCTYSWNFGVNATPQTATGTSATTQFSAAAVGTAQTITLTVTKNGCSATFTKNINVTPEVFANAGPDKEICQGGSTQIGGSPAGPAGGTFTWSPNTFLNSNTVANPIASPPVTTTYTLTTTLNGCTRTDQVVVSVNVALNPNANAGGSKTICNGQSVQLGGNPTSTNTGVSYVWSPANSLSGAYVSNPTAYPTTNTTYTVTVTNTTTGCSATSSAAVTVTTCVTPELSISDITVTEGINPTATLQICTSTASTLPITVTYTTSNGTALSGTDYTTTTATATIPAGQTCVNVTIPIVDDAINEPTENFTVALTNPSNATIADGTGIVTILDNDVLVPTLSINDVTVNENAGTATLQICASAATTVPITVTYTTSNGTAISGTDYTTTTATATIPAGQTCVNVTLPIVDDLINEPTETFNVTLSSPTGATINDGTGIVTILDNDVLVPALSINDVTVNENAGTATLQICASAATTVPITVTYTTSNGTAISGTDYTTTTATATIPAGQTCVNVTIPITDDLVNEPTETFNVTLSSPTGATINDGAGIVTILDNDANAPTLSINDVIVTEGVNPTATLQICTSVASTLPITVSYSTSNGTALSGADYTATSATATIPAGQTCVNISIPIIDDANIEPTETFNVVLLNPTNATIADGTGIVTILDNDPVCNNVTSAGTIAANQSGVSPFDPAMLTQTAAPVGGSNYEYKWQQSTDNSTWTDIAGATSMTYDPGVLTTTTYFRRCTRSTNCTTWLNTNVITITVTPAGTIITIGDKVFFDANNNGIQDGGSEVGLPGVTVNLFNATGGWVASTTTNANGLYSFSSTTISSLVAGSYRVCFNKPWNYSNVSPKDQGTDDAIDSDVNAFSGGSACTDLFTVVAGETKNTIDLGLNNATTPTLPTLSINDVEVNENAGTATLQICASATSTSPITVTYTTSNGTALSGTDYTTTTATATIPAGQTCVNVTVPIVDDLINEPNETFTVILSTPTGATINDGTGVVTILDNDNPIQDVPSLSINDITVTEGTNPTATLQICASATSTSPISVTYTTSNGTAMMGTDYTTTTATATIPAGQTCVNVTIPIIDDAINEPTETFNVTLTNPSNAVIGDGTGIVTILDNDPTGSTTITIGDKVFFDANNNGIQDGGSEVGLPGVTVNLYNATGGWLGSSTSNANGLYSFSSTTIPALVAGSYRVCFNKPWNYSNVSPKDQGTDDAIDSDVNAFSGGSACTDLFTVVAGETKNTIDLGLNNATTPTLPTLSINDVEVNENAGTATLQICASATSTSPITVTYTTSNGTALSGTDYTTTTATATIPAGQTCVNVSIPIVDDAINEPTETFTVILSTPTGANINDGTGIVTILDNDNPIQNVPSVSINDVTVTEGVNPTATLQICASATSTSPISVTYTTSNGTAMMGTDYTTTTATATIPAGQTCVNVTIPIIDDAINEPTETFNVTLSSPTNAVIGDGTGIVTILDNDPTGSTTITIGDKVFFDANNNGIQDGGSEVGLPGVTVNLYNATGGWLGSSTSNANGLYSFSSTTISSLVAGSYRVCFNKPWNYSNVSPKDQGTDDAIDSDVNAFLSGSACTDLFTVAAGETKNTIDAGLNNGVTPTLPTLASTT